MIVEKRQKTIKNPPSKDQMCYYYTTKIYVFPLLFSLAIGNVIIKSQAKIFKMGKR
jgi:hypothetical protein